MGTAISGGPASKWKASGRDCAPSLPAKRGHHHDPQAFEAIRRKSEQGMTSDQTYRQYAIEEYTLEREPFYIPIKDEIELFHAAYSQKIPVLLKGPTGCGKTRFIEYMAYKLGRPLTVVKDMAETDERQAGGKPLGPVARHADLT